MRAVVHTETHPAEILHQGSIARMEMEMEIDFPEPVNIVPTGTAVAKAAQPLSLLWDKDATTYAIIILVATYRDRLQQHLHFSPHLE